MAIRRNILVVVSTFLLMFAAVSIPAQAALFCGDVYTRDADAVGVNNKLGQEILAQRATALPARSEATQALARFAQENNLPYRWVTLGPAERRVQRLFIGLDTDNAPLMQKYHETFNLNTSL